MRKAIILFRYFKTLGLVTLCEFLWQRFVKKKKLLSIKLTSLPHKILIRNQPADIAVFTQVFVEKEYEVALGHPVNTLIDCGANIGLAALFFLSKFPQAQITCVEPEENNFRLLQQNLQPYKNVSCIKAGVWHKNTNLQIVDNGWGSQGFRVKETEAQDAVPAITIAHIMQQMNIEKVDIVKLDIEGSEEQVLLQDGSGWLQQTQTLFVEIHEGLKKGLTERILSKLQNHFSYFINGEYFVFTQKQSV